jgi:hypothetical protein
MYLALVVVPHRMVELTHLPEQGGMFLEQPAVMQVHQEGLTHLLVEVDMFLAIQIIKEQVVQVGVIPNLVIYLQVCLYT